MGEKAAVKKILIVDDSPVERALLRGLLKRHWPECEISEADDGEEGLQAVENLAPDLVLADVCMPRSSGLDMLTRLREKKSLVPVVVMSGVGNEQTAVEALQSGAASYLPKLNLPELLVSTVSMISELSETHRNRRRIFSCLRSMDLRFELENDNSLVSPLIKYLEDHIGSLRLCDEHELVRIGVALHESLSNAMNHGNLELDSELRQEDESIYYELAATRRIQWPYCDRRVQVFASLDPRRIRFVIRDAGPGFNHRKAFDPTAQENLERIGGRGLLLIRSFMDEVSYNGRGNEITLVKYTSAGQKLLAKMCESSSKRSTTKAEVAPQVTHLEESADSADELVCEAVC